MDSLKKRYFFKLGGNILGFLLSFLTASIIPRALGVEKYGFYGYLSNFFTQLLAFFDFKTSTCFYIKISQNQDDRKIVTFYSIVVLLVFFLSIISTAFFSISFFKHFFFENIFLRWLFLACFLAFFLWFTDVLTNFMDALGKTVYLEKIRMFTKLLGVFFILIIFYWSQITLDIYFIFQILLSIIFIISVIILIRRNPLLKLNYTHFSKSDFIIYSKTFFKYSYPLVGYMALQLVGNIFDRWILMKYCGSIQQGLYSLSFSLMQVMFLFVNAIYPLLTREISIAAGERNYAKMSEIFSKFYPILFAVIAYFCAFIFINSSTVVFLFGGQSFNQSEASLRILMIYPLIAAFSGINSSIVYSTNRTKLFLILALIFTPIGIILDIILINPNILNLGAAGLAIKVVIVEFISMFCILIINSKIIKIHVFKYLIHFLYFLVFLLFAYLSSLLIYKTNSVLLFVFSGFVYSILIFLVVMYFPGILGLENNISIFINRTLLKFLNLRNENINKWFRP